MYSSCITDGMEYLGQLIHLAFPFRLGDGYFILSLNVCETNAMIGGGDRICEKNGKFLNN